MKDIVKALRAKNIIVQCFISRYIGTDVKVSRYICPWANRQENMKIKAFARHSDRAFSKSEIRNLQKQSPSLRRDEYGGKTEVLLVDVDSKAVMGHGEAICRNDEKFNRSRGFEIALNRALKIAKVEI